MGRQCWSTCWTHLRTGETHRCRPAYLVGCELEIIFICAKTKLLPHPDRVALVLRLFFFFFFVPSYLPFGRLSWRRAQLQRWLSPPQDPYRSQRSSIRSASRRRRKRGFNLLPHSTGGAHTCHLQLDSQLCRRRVLVYFSLLSFGNLLCAERSPPANCWQRSLNVGGGGKSSIKKNPPPAQCKFISNYFIIIIIAGARKQIVVVVVVFDESSEKGDILCLPNTFGSSVIQRSPGCLKLILLLLSTPTIVVVGSVSMIMIEHNGSVAAAAAAASDDAFDIVRSNRQLQPPDDSVRAKASEDITDSPAPAPAPVSGEHTDATLVGASECIFSFNSICLPILWQFIGN